MVVVVRGVLLRSEGLWLLGCFRSFGGGGELLLWWLQFKMPLVDALWNRDVNAGWRNIQLEGAMHHGYLHSGRSVEN